MPSENIDAIADRDALGMGFFSNVMEDSIVLEFAAMPEGIHHQTTSRGRFAGISKLTTK